MPYQVTILPSALRSLAKLPEGIRVRIMERIGALANDPRPPGCVKLAGEEILYRIRVGDYRVIYEVHDDRFLVVVVKVGNRRDVYR